jgi:acetoin utilization deacetylase AcuC-like enzyme
VVSLGFDTYRLDPICDLGLTTDGYRRIGHRVADLGLPTVIIQEGGYHVPDLGANARSWLRGFQGLNAAVANSGPAAEPESAGDRPARPGRHV